MPFDTQWAAGAGRGGLDHRGPGLHGRVLLAGGRVPRHAGVPARRCRTNAELDQASDAGDPIGRCQQPARQASGYDDRALMAATVPSSRWTVVFSVPKASLFAAVDGSPAQSAWLAFAAFAVAILGLLGLPGREGHARAGGRHRAGARGHRPRPRAASRPTDRASEPDAVRPASRARGSGNRQGAVGRSRSCSWTSTTTSASTTGSATAGDEVLREIARRLVRSVREADTVCRFGDEFVILCEDVSGAREALLFVDRIRAGLRGPLDIGGRAVSVTFSIGVVDRWGRPRAHRRAARRERRRRDVRAKEGGRGRVAVFDATLHRARRWPALDDARRAAHRRRAAAVRRPLPADRARRGRRCLRRQGRSCAGAAPGPPRWSRRRSSSGSPRRSA